jgi:hypothetical protein
MFMMLILIGSATFWGMFFLIRLLKGPGFDSMAVGFLTIITPLLTWAVTYYCYKTIVASQRGSIIPALLVGIVGPLLPAWLYGLWVAIVSQSKFDSQWFMWLTVLGPLSAFTYSGMLGAMLITLVGTLLLWRWLSGGR